MDADTRHQLKQNELAEALSKLVDFRDKRTTGWLIAIIVVALAYAGYKFWSWRAQTLLIDAQQLLSEINSGNPEMGEAPLEQLRRLIADNSQPGLLALARLKLAEGLEARARVGGDEARLTEAEQEYDAILSMPKAPLVTKAPALYRLGIIRESRRDFEKAREAYLTLSQSEGYRGSPFAAVAKERLEQLDDLTKPVVFLPGMSPIPEPVPAPGPTTQRALQPVPIIDASGESLPIPTATAPPPPSDEEEAPAEEPAEETTEPEQP